MDQNSEDHAAATKRVRNPHRRFARLIAWASRRATVMFIPHSERPVRSTQLSAISILFFVVLGIVVVVTTTGMLISMDNQHQSAQLGGTQLRHAEASLETARMEIANMLLVFDRYSDVLLSVLDLSPGAEPPVETGGLRSILDIERTADGAISEVSALKDAAGLFRLLPSSLAEISGALELLDQVASDLPTEWPVINGLGRTAMEFGPNIHPLLDSWYMHKGIDIAYFRGTPVVASGNGTVTDAGFDSVSGYGGFVEIQHEYGFSTKYTHLGSVGVSDGQSVRQGDTIGLLGNTGISTGPHVHYEITVGTEVIDPAPFLKISQPDFTRRTENRW